MDQNEHQHPSLADLVEAVAGRLPDPRQYELDQHCADCASCMQQLVRLHRVRETFDSIWDQLSAGGTLRDLAGLRALEAAAAARCDAGLQAQLAQWMLCFADRTRVITDFLATTAGAASERIQHGIAAFFPGVRSPLPCLVPQPAGERVHGTGSDTSPLQTRYDGPAGMVLHLTCSPDQMTLRAEGAGEDEPLLCLFHVRRGPLIARRMNCPRGSNLPAAVFSLDEIGPGPDGQAPEDFISNTYCILLYVPCRT